MNRIVASLGVILLASCAARGTGGTGADQGGPGRPSRESQVYAAVIRQLVLVDHGYGSADSPYEVVYVLNGPVRGAADPLSTMDELEPAAPFSSDLRDELLDQLSDLPPVEFVSSREAVTAGKPPGHVIKNGVLITLEPIQWTGTEGAVVGSSRWVNGLNGQWVTYVLSVTDSKWRVSGTKGPVSIS